MKYSNFSALGIHVFQGHFTAGIKKYFNIRGQLELFGLGVETTKHNLKIPVWCYDFNKWNLVADEINETGGVDIVFGNPRCSGFSPTTHGCEAHGVDAPQNIDIKQLFKFAFTMLKHKPKIICFESVPQTGKAGRPLIQKLANTYGHGYRLAEIYHKACQFGNAQQRKRVVFIFYKNDLHCPAFEVAEKHTVNSWTPVWSVIKRFKDFNAEEMPKGFMRKNVTLEDLQKLNPEPVSVGIYNMDYDYNYGRSDARVLFPILKYGQSINKLTDEQLKIAPKFYATRMHGASFGFHAATRIHPEKHIGTVMGFGTKVHPFIDRPLTIRELAAIMGMPDNYVYLGENIRGQVGKALCIESASYVGDLMYNILSGEIKRKKESNEGWEIFNVDRLAPTKPIPNKKRGKYEDPSQLSLSI